MNVLSADEHVFEEETDMKRSMCRCACLMVALLLFAGGCATEFSASYEAAPEFSSVIRDESVAASAPKMPAAI